MCVVETREHVERSLADGPTRILLLDNESLSLFTSLFVLPSSSYSKGLEELATLVLNFNV